MDKKNPTPGLNPHHEMMDLFEKPSFRQRMRLLVSGLHESKDSGAYKSARLEMLRLLSPISSVVVPCVSILVITILGKMAPPPVRQVQVRVMEPDTVEKLDETETIPEDMPVMPPDMTLPEGPAAPPSDAPVIGPPIDLNVPVADLDAVAMVKSPVVMKGILGMRNSGMRERAIRAGGGRHPEITEAAVLRALRWLKKYQEQDGSWTQTSGGGPGSGRAAAMTGFALLAYLAHGETPSSEEFGPTVEKAIRWLCNNQSSDGRWATPYEHQIAAYALSEAYAITRIPMLQEKAVKGIGVVVQGQNASGGWDYGLSPGERDDSSVMAWCAQALKAAKMAGLEVAGLDSSMRKAIDGFKKNADPNGGFGYATTKEHGTGATGLTGAGVLSMQFLGAMKEKETIAGLKYLRDNRLAFDWSTATWTSIYYWYYDTQARFQSQFYGGLEDWKKWERLFAVDLAKNQTVLPGQGVDGKDIGYWTTTSDDQGWVMNTALCTLMLEVYYRYLPTYKQVDEVKSEEFGVGGEVDVKITI